VIFATAVVLCVANGDARAAMTGGADAGTGSSAAKKDGGIATSSAKRDASGSVLGAGNRESFDAGVDRSTPPRAFTVPEIIDTVDIPGEQKALGVPMKLRSVRSRLQLGDVQYDVMKQFHDAGLYIPPPNHVTQTAKEPIIVALDPVTLIAYAAIFQPNADKTTTVILGTAYLARRDKSARPEWGPVYPTADRVVMTDVEFMQAASYAVRVKEQDLRGFYEKVLPGAGFEKVADDTWDRGAERIHVVYSQDKDGSVRVLMTRQQTGGTE
jgi:hypothetical protein